MIELTELETPALLVDLERMAANLDRAAAYSKKHKIALRPHTLTLAAEPGTSARVWIAGTIAGREFVGELVRYTVRIGDTLLIADEPHFIGRAPYQPDTTIHLGIDPDRQVLEIGGTYFGPKFRGTGFNRRVKDMMLKRAFDCGIRRVEFRVDTRNERSQAAMKKLGAVREGVLRADRITWTGHVRDTVLFAILKDEWPV